MVMQTDSNGYFRARKTRWHRMLLQLFAVLSLATSAALGDWSEDQLSKLPKSEEPIHLFNGQNLDGWEGRTEKYFSVQDGMIVGKNSDKDAPKASTYLATQKHYRNFRLIFESRLVTSEMHSGISLWGKLIEKEEGPFSYQGHLVMYPSGYGYYDLYRRNSIYQDKLGVAKRAGKQHDWNQMEILAIGNRIRHVVNGKLVADWSDPKPELCEAGPIGLQLHSNQVAQEVQWRGLILTEEPEDLLVTAQSKDLGLLPSGNPAESGLNSEKLKLIDPAMQAFVDKQQAAGIVTLVARRGRIVHVGAVGQANIENKLPMTTETIFPIASMTKPMTAAALMILVDQGKVQLDDPVSKYIPAFASTTLSDGKTPQRPVTVRDCLMHTSGLVSDQRNVGTLANTADSLGNSKLAFEPGSKWQYGPGLSVAGRIVEIASGSPFDSFMKSNIFEPLGMQETSFLPTAEQQKRLASLYGPSADKKNLELGKHWLTELSGEVTPNPSGGLYSTAADVSKFYQMILNGGELNGKRILSASSVAEMTRVQTGNLETGFTPGNGWGLGFCLVVQPQGVTESLSPGSFGHGGAFGTQSWGDPQKEMIFILMVCRQNFGNGDGSDLRGTLQRLATEAIVK